jgi:hypothetical protein
MFIIFYRIRIEQHFLFLFLNFILAQFSNTESKQRLLTMQAVEKLFHA